MSTRTDRIGVLIVATQYSPCNNAAAHRVASFARYLDPERFDVTVVSELHSQGDGRELPHVRACLVPNRTPWARLELDGAESAFIHYGKAAYNLMVRAAGPDPWWDWRRRALAKAREIIPTGDIRVVLSSYGPAAAHWVGARLKHAFPRLAWIADMRDEMRLFPEAPGLERFALHLGEQDVLRRADAITSVSSLLLDQFREAAPRRLLRFREIRNGYDFPLGNPCPPNPVFTISFAGTFWHSIRPHAFLAALSDLVGERAIEAVRVLFVGRIGQLRIPANLRHMVEVRPHVPHEQAIDLMKRSDALFLPLPTAMRRPGAYGAKLFEYLAALRPIIATLDPESVAAQLIREARGGFVADDRSHTQVKQAILCAYRVWQGQEPFSPEFDVVRRHHRKQQTAILAELIEELLDPAGAGCSGS